jgi:5-oxoprolinase (ATP-hydrolysing)
VSVDHIAELFDQLVHSALDELWMDRNADEQIKIHRFLDLRYLGADASLTIAEPDDGDFGRAFEKEHRRLYGFEQPGRSIEIVAARVKVVQVARPILPKLSLEKHWNAEPHETRPLYSGGRWQPAGIFRRERLSPGAIVNGPAIIVEPLTTTIIEDSCRAEMLSDGALHVLWLARAKPGLEESTPPSSTPDPVLLEVFSNHFTAIATQMGITLRNTATSVNVKERLDFSCAIFTAAGDLVVNAPHIPVHLGAMGETVKCIIADNPDMQPGDVFVTNDPYRGGSHLPDVTVVTPVFGGTLNSVLFFTASRAHHAEIGGITPGSMPPFSRNLAEEGVLIRNFKLLEGGVPRIDELRSLLTSGPYPSRSPDANLADITAQLAANQQGALDLAALIDRYTQPVVVGYMRHIQDAAERKMRAALAKLRWREQRYFDFLDDGTRIQVTITTAGEQVTIDFTGTGPVSRGNLNANRAIVTAAVMYVLRLVVGEDIPLNEGVLAPVKIILPECLLNPPAAERPEDCPAVAGGNVETSQRIVDVLIHALKLAADSQGTMNNLLFGDETFGYYETICGGSGATPDSDGADAVHTHMTNTRLTDPEVLEARYPVRLREFSIRRGSGGTGQHRGGDGVIRRIEFLRELTLSILSQRRGPYPPQGNQGGSPGALGQNTLRRPGIGENQLAGSVQISVEPGDVLTIETPGGGGWGNTNPKR